MRKNSVTTQAPTVAFLYLRVSTARQATDGIGLDAQEAKARAHAERMGLTVGEVFRDEGVSGKDGVEDRPALAALIAHAKANPGAIVIVYSISRLARRQRLLWNLLDDRDGHGLKVVSATEQFDAASPMGRAMLGMIAVFAQLEADMVSERTKDALAELKAQGKALGQKTIAELSPETALIVQDMYKTGLYSHASLAAELNRLNIPTATGRGKWWVRTVQSALSAKVDPI